MIPPPLETAAAFSLRVSHQPKAGYRYIPLTVPQNDHKRTFMSENENSAPLHPRQSQIVDIAKGQGQVSVDMLTLLLDVTPQTIRRDLKTLCARDILHRVHGGAVYPAAVTNLTHERRRALKTGAKRAIARRAAAEVPDKAALILNIGTTTEAVAAALRMRRDIMVITNNLNIAQMLAPIPGIDVHVAGGKVRPADNAIIGQSAVAAMGQFRADVAIIGASGIDPDGTLLDFDTEEVHVARAIIAQARKVILVADHSKFSRRPPVCIAGIDDLDMVITDQAPPQDFQHHCDAAGVRVVVTGEEMDDG